MSISIPDRVVVFDYGEVISTTPTPDDRARLLEVAGLGTPTPESSADRFWAAYWQHRHDLDRGALSAAGYWRRIAEDLGTHWDAGTLQQLWAADFRGWLNVEPATVQIMQELRDGGTRVAILSNAGRDYGSPFRASPIGELVEAVFVSAELDELKPAARIYEVVAEQLGIATSEIVFIDNRTDNVDGAVAVGATGHVFTGPAALREFLEQLAG